ncbi:MAG: Gfo/Idh/MocA family oxidoreductase [Lentisphaerae bacterium]|nr:Gfo/Idh/MocA family oxidoreductase [Lentisphaerota bacterium]
MADKKLRIGVAGLGRIGWAFHCKRLGAHADWTLAAVADTEAARRQEAVDTYGCQAFADFTEMCAKGNLDAVVIATPTHLHEAMVMTAFQHGLHVLLEKPMAPTYAEAERIVVAAEKAGKVLTVYQPHRLGAYFQHLKSIVNDGRIGRVTMLQRGAFSFARRNDWQSLQKYGGGMLNNYGAHYLDQVLQLVGYDIHRVWCCLQKVASLGDADDVVKILLELKGGVVADCTISQATVGKLPYEIIVWGTCGNVELFNNQITVRWFDPAALPAREVNPSLASTDRKYPSETLPVQTETVPVDPAYQVDVHTNLAQAIRGTAPVFVPARQTLALMDLLARCRESSAGIRVP